MSQSDPAAAEPQETDRRPPRRHDLDALRGFAMLLGIVLHAALAYVGFFGWPGNEGNTLGSLGLAVPAIHGFRMHLFFLLSGFFTAMLFSRRGLTELVAHRLKRIALPLAIGLVTIVPVVWGALLSSESLSAAPTPVVDDQPADQPPESLHEAAGDGRLEWIDRFLDEGADPDGLDPTTGITPLAFAVFGDHAQSAERLLDRGADPNAHYRDGYSALHTSAFLGRVEIMQLLLDAGGDANLQNPNNGEKPFTSTLAPQQMTEAICAFLGVEIDFDDVAAGREQIVEMLNAADAEPEPFNLRELVVGLLFMFPVFHHLWFLWFLLWMVTGFAIVVTALRVLRLNKPLGATGSLLVGTPLCLLFLLPISLVLQWPMHERGVQLNFGPDTSVGLLPMPHVLAFYCVFFFFGALLYAVPGAIDRVSRFWWLMLPLGLALLVPGLALSMRLPLAEGWIESQSAHHAATAVLQVLYAWLMTFGLIGLFRVLLSGERAWVRYLSDSSYWLYLAHLPLIMFGQIALTHVELPAVVKVLILTAGSTGLLLLAYQLGIRYTIIGRTLNGPRSRPDRSSPNSGSSPAA